MGCGVRWAPWRCSPLPGCCSLSSRLAGPRCQGSPLAAGYPVLRCWKLGFSLVVRRIGHKHNPWSLLVFFFYVGRYPHLRSSRALPSTAPPQLLCWLPQLHRHPWGSALDPGAAGHPPAGMVKDMGVSEQPSGVNLGREGGRGGLHGMLEESFRWKKDGGPAGLVGQEVMPALGKDTKPWLCSELQGRWWSRGSGCTTLPGIQWVRRCLEQPSSSSFLCSSSSHNSPPSLHASCWWV